MDRVNEPQPFHNRFDSDPVPPSTNRLAWLDHAALSESKSLLIATQPSSEGGV